jgi:hypothetical protein
MMSTARSAHGQLRSLGAGHHDRIIDHHFSQSFKLSRLTATELPLTCSSPFRRPLANRLCSCLPISSMVLTAVACDCVYHSQQTEMCHALSLFLSYIYCQYMGPSIGLVLSPVRLAGPSVFDCLLPSYTNLRLCPWPLFLYHLDCRSVIGCVFCHHFFASPIGCCFCMIYPYRAKQS